MGVFYFINLICKLKTVADYLNVNLKNAHRAYHDAYATAEIFLKLNELM